MSPAQLAQSAPQTAGLVSARVVLDAGEDVADIATRLGIAAEQLAWGGDGALHAELDLPAGSWRVFPPARIALWISLRPGHEPPPAPAGSPLVLARIVPRLRRRGVRFRDVELHDGKRWSAPMGAADALRTLGTSGASGICAVWSCTDRHPARIEVFNDGVLWASSPADAAWWVTQGLGHE